MFKNLFMAGLAAIVVPAFAAEWMTDLDAAKTKAAAENKAVLVDFTGSDWCGYCIRLKKAVFDTPEFDAYAADKFILVEIDVPNDVKRVGGPEQFAKNQALCQQYQVSGFPTIMVLNADNQVLGGFVGGQPNLAATQKPLDAALENGKKLAAAQTLQGVDKAKALMEVYTSLPSDMQGLATNLLQEVEALDTENVTGIQNLAREKAILKQFEKELKACGRDADKALALVNSTLPKVTANNREALLELKFMILRSKIETLSKKAETLEDIAAIKALMQQSIDCLPAKYRKEAEANLEKEFANPAALLSELKAQRK
ncbi:MAG: thioredoxin family protein [Akkermansia sp.]|nr:thioredoxin family protein [Akkermansia sp.]